LFLDTAESNAGNLPPTTVVIAVLKAVICSSVKSRLFKNGVSSWFCTSGVNKVSIALLDSVVIMFAAFCISTLNPAKSIVVLLVNSDNLCGKAPFNHLDIVFGSCFISPVTGSTTSTISLGLNLPTKSTIPLLPYIPLAM